MYPLCVPTRTTTHAGYDIRFAEYAMAASAAGAELLVYPGAFNHVTGPVHWELLQRARALDNQLYVATASPALDPNCTYQVRTCVGCLCVRVRASHDAIATS